jgi:uncharacterized protein (TIGR02588 family)
MARRGHRQTPAAERIASLLGGAIVLTTICFLGYEAVQRGDGAPALTVSVIQIRETTGSFVVDIEVRNDSRSAAADVHLAGHDRTADGQQIQARASLDYVAGFSSRRASLVFQSDPGRNPVIGIIGYSRP